MAAVMNMIPAGALTQQYWMDAVTSFAVKPADFVAASYSPSVFWPVLGAVAYAITIWAIKQRSGPAMTLTGVAVVHNINLILLSAAMAIGAALELYSRYETEGSDGLFCSQRSLATTLDGPAGYWMKIYYVSKYYEFGDTVILALKKKPTIPLHLYHHCVMVFLTWSWSTYGWFEGSLWCVLVNSIIHFFMYTYYLLAALGHSVWWKRYLTGCQIFQFITGFLYVSLFFYRHATKGCGGNVKIIVAMPTYLVNVSFIYMFYQFFKAGAPKKDKKGDNKKKGSKKE